MPSIKTQISAVLDSCTKSISTGRPLPNRLNGLAAEILVNECNKRGINSKLFLESETECTPGTILKDGIKLGLAQSRHLQFLRRNEIVIQLDNSISLLSHLLGPEYSRFKKALAGKSLSERFEVYSGFPGMRRQIVELANLEIRRSRVALQRSEKITEWYFQKIAQDPSAKKTDLYYKMDSGKELEPAQKREYGRLSLLEHNLDSQFRVNEKKMNAVIQSHFQLVFKRPNLLLEIKSAQHDPALGKRQKSFFERAEQSLKLKRKL